MGRVSLRVPTTRTKPLSQMLEEAGRYGVSAWIDRALNVHDYQYNGRIRTWPSEISDEGGGRGGCVGACEGDRWARRGAKGEDQVERRARGGAEGVKGGRRREGLMC